MYEVMLNKNTVPEVREVLHNGTEVIVTYYIPYKPFPDGKMEFKLQYRNKVFILNGKKHLNPKEIVKLINKKISKMGDGIWYAQYEM